MNFAKMVYFDEILWQRNDENTIDDLWNSDLSLFLDTNLKSYFSGEVSFDSEIIVMHNFVITVFILAQKEKWTSKGHLALKKLAVHLVHLSGGAVLLVELKSKKNFIHPRDLRIRVI